MVLVVVAMQVLSHIELRGKGLRFSKRRCENFALLSAARGDMEPDLLPPMQTLFDGLDSVEELGVSTTMAPQNERTLVLSTYRPRYIRGAVVSRFLFYMNDHKIIKQVAYVVERFTHTPLAVGSSPAYG
ncbi:hypothetical protein VNO77_04346 [Canavalia gladiata]|uniref:Uncharacterized protein n=1 Tax=Canavalia gladiata TaxID=3824 RepID=A0AAN9R7P5_CANGL